MNFWYFNFLSQNDAGVYEVIAANTAGARTASVRVIVLEKPGPISDLQATDITNKSVVLSWSPPSVDGGCAIRYQRGFKYLKYDTCNFISIYTTRSYTVDYRTPEEPQWKEISCTIVRSTYKCIGLTKGKEYTFRIRANNRFGCGPATQTPTVIPQLGYKVGGTV